MEDDQLLGYVVVCHHAEESVMGLGELVQGCLQVCHPPLEKALNRFGSLTMRASRLLAEALSPSIAVVCLRRFNLSAILEPLPGRGDSSTQTACRRRQSLPAVPLGDTGFLMLPTEETS